jgi:nucleoside-diphosphate-sugar epimerase
MLDQRPAILLGRVQAQWRWTHGFVGNVAQAIARAVNNERANGQIYNVGEVTTPTMIERIRQIGNVMGWTGKIIPFDRDRLPPHLQTPVEPDQDLVMDSSRIREELGFMETSAVEEGLRQTIAWEGANPPDSGDPGPDQYAAEDAALA